MFPEMAQLMNIVRREAHRVAQLYSHPKVGEVSAYDPKTHMVKVKLKPRDNETGWIPIATQHVGGGFGVMSGPEIGDQVEIGYQEGDSNTPRMMGRFHSDKAKPPEVKSGEHLIKTKSGAGLFIDKDGGAKLVSAPGKLLKINMGGLPT